MAMLPILDQVALCIAGGLLVGYNIFFFWMIGSRSPQQHASKNIDVMYSWAHKHLSKQDPASCTLAIQVLRNMMVVATFVAAASFSYSISVLKSISDDTLDLADRIGAMIMALCVFCSFICMTQVIRAGIHIGFLFGVASKDHSETNKRSPEAWKKRFSVNAMNLADKIIFNFSFGFRLLYGAIPFAFFFVGPVSMMVASVFVLVLQFNMDFDLTFVWDFFVHYCKVILGEHNEGATLLVDVRTNDTADVDPVICEK